MLHVAQRLMVLLAYSALACSSPEMPLDGSSGQPAASGGIAATGGAANRGGSQATGGIGPQTTGGSSSGSTSTAGTATNGGATSTSITSGGVTATGGTPTGGSFGTGGKASGGTPTGGSVGTGGRATGGTATGGSSGSTVAPTNGEIWISPTGSDSNPGTKDRPLATIKQAASLAGPGKLIYMRGGKYPLSAAVSVKQPPGTAQAPIRLWAFPGEQPELDFATGGGTLSKGLSIDASYWHVKGLIVENSAGRGIQVSTGTGIVIEACTTRYNGDMGLVVSNGASNVLILNCDSHHNFGAANGGENADGFGAKSNVGTGVVFRGCRAFQNADDGWDLYGAPSAVRLENCWAYKNGDNFTNASNFNGDGNGFKLGHSAGDLAHHVAVNCLAWGNYGANGFEDNNNTGGLTLYNNVAYKNKGAGFETINVTKHIVKNNISLLNGRADDVLVGSDESHNSWNGLAATENDFVSVDDSVAVGARQADGSLPATDFLHLKSSSALIDKGVDVGLPFLGAAPDLGAYELK